MLLNVDILRHQPFARILKEKDGASPYAARAAQPVQSRHRRKVSHLRQHLLG